MIIESPRSVALQITPDEALVLFDFLQRFGETKSLLIHDQAEERVLWNLSCLLEKVLSEPFAKNYNALLADARERLRDEQ